MLTVRTVVMYRILAREKKRMWMFEKNRKINRKIRKIQKKHKKLEKNIC